MHKDFERSFKVSKEKNKKDSVPKSRAKEKTVGLLFKFLPSLLVIAAITAMGMFLYRAVFLSSYFNTEEAMLVWHDELEVANPYKYNKLSRTGKGENIFKLDIRGAASGIMSTYPEFKNCVIERQFPNRLVIDIYVRQPVIQVDYKQFYLIDEDAMLLSEARISALENLPVIAGMKWRPPKKVGEIYRSNRLPKALELLGAIEGSGLLRGHSLRKIDVSDHRNLVFFIEDGLQIKIGRSHFEERLGLLKEALSSAYIDRNELEYIDLRFDDIVFGTK